MDDSLLTKIRASLKSLTDEAKFKDARVHSNHICLHSSCLWRSFCDHVPIWCMLLQQISASTQAEEHAEQVNGCAQQIDECAKEINKWHTARDNLGVWGISVVLGIKRFWQNFDQFKNMV
jgi:hypothetical protein